MLCLLSRKGTYVLYICKNCRFLDIYKYVYLLFLLFTALVGAVVKKTRSKEPYKTPKIQQKTQQFAIFSDLSLNFFNLHRFFFTLS
ncbi:hypothetical protein L6452_30171 [Arctium lappa]|uniref:Uncharacterized protein n=1 Tax=Arctium lappa TaxID=4217 RepID=A0ACB8ZIE3_ARCLA|nr:hypothetical protein L6452_30171 [Arctium lappa]